MIPPPYARGNSHRHWLDRNLGRLQSHCGRGDETKCPAATPVLHGPASRLLLVLDCPALLFSGLSYVGWVLIVPRHTYWILHWRYYECGMEKKNCSHSSRQHWIQTSWDPGQSYCTAQAKRPITVTAKSNALNVFATSNTGIVGSKPTRGMDVCLRLFCLCRQRFCVGLIPRPRSPTDWLRLRNWSETKRFMDALCSKWEQQE
jgi:hypothetical protein